MSEKDVLRYPERLEECLCGIEDCLVGSYSISKRTASLLLLQDDPEILAQVKDREGIGAPDILEKVEYAKTLYNLSSAHVIGTVQQSAAAAIADQVTTKTVVRRDGFRERLSEAMMRPLTGVPILALVLYFGLYLFVGVFGAGILVDLIEGRFFGQIVNPWITDLVVRILPVKVLQDLFVGEFGIITLGVSYAFAIVLPIVTAFFIVFSIIEDSGYLPRLAMLVDRVFKKIGLNGRAIIPLVLGLGCDTMATIVTRTQETRRERILTTLLLALVIPCSAQLGVVMGILSSSPISLIIWASLLVFVFLAVGFVASRILPGKKASFFMEIPPLRLPRATNVLIKTYARLKWYLLEVIPIFIGASILLWLGELTGVFEILVQRVMVPVVSFVGLPPETAVAFFFGFFRRDFGAAGLYDLHNSGDLGGIPLLVSAVTLTLFLPCVAQLFVMFKERGVKVTLAISLFIFPFAFFIGFILNLILTGLGVVL